MSAEDISKTLTNFRQMKIVESRGWHIQQAANRLRVFSPEHSDREGVLRTWIVGETVDEALSFIYGYEEARRIHRGE